MMGKARRYLQDMRDRRQQANRGYVMAKSKLVKDTTRAEREEIIKLALAGCGNGSCDNCGSCSLGAGDPYGTYQPYIDGEMEIADINMMVAERNAKLFGLQRG